MINQYQIKKLTLKYQTTELNIVSEYFQHLFLSYFYQHPKGSAIYFKGGTALHTVYHSPRFSEDLDFSAGKLNIKELEQILLYTLDQIEKENVSIVLQEAKITSGGYLANIAFELPELQRVVILLEISFRQDKLEGEVTTISSDFVPPYTIFILSTDLLVEEKIQALISRKKPRDFYDLYFILRSNLLTPSKKAVLPQILKILEQTDINFETELKLFLPKMHWPIIRDFKQILEKEIKRFI